MDNSDRSRRGRDQNPYYSGARTDHFDGTMFFNPDGIEPRGFRDLLRWKLGGGKKTWPKRVPSPFSPASPDNLVSGDSMRVTMVGHATMLIQIDGLNILTDPVWSDRASPFSFAGPRRANDPGITFEKLPPIHLVLLTHNHYDHCDVSTLARLQKEHAPDVITPLGNDTILQKHIPDMKVITADWDEAVPYGALTIHLEPCHHWSARGMRDRRLALWAAFVIETPAGKIYHIGDTGFHKGRNYRAAAAKHTGFRLAILPIGAYEPRWFMEAQHQDPDEAVEGFQLANAQYAVGHHWGTFQLTDEAHGEPLERLTAALDRNNIARERFRALMPGEVFDVPPV